MIGNIVFIHSEKLCHLFLRKPDGFVLHKYLYFYGTVRGGVEEERNWGSGRICHRILARNNGLGDDLGVVVSVEDC